MHYFNTEGACYPEKHYMVDITGKLLGIKEMVDAGKYFAINKGRQYGKPPHWLCWNKPWRLTIYVSV
jgi:hypothetical protein